MVPLSAQAIAAPSLPSAPVAASAASSFDGDRSSHTRGSGSREFRGDSDWREHRHDDRAGDWRRHDDRWRRHDHRYRCGWGPDRDRYWHYRHRYAWDWDWDCSPYWRR
ncbi:hypothetical protein [Streptomyces sp. NPDC096132]|uniref:hypothetical protein n=1 Tax=Streptomyces sp. NPDC096132 TaxID=3366075 RepID=UPI0037F2BF9B